MLSWGPSGGDGVAAATTAPWEADAEDVNPAQGLARGSGPVALTAAADMSGGGLSSINGEGMCGAWWDGSGCEEPEEPPVMMRGPSPTDGVLPEAIRVASKAKISSLMTSS